MAGNTEVVHVHKWKEFKKLAIISHPQFIAYSVQNAPLSRPPVGLRLVFSTERIQYVFLDFAHGNTFTRTKLPVYINDNGIAYFKEEDLKDFIYSELNRRDISIVSFEILGY